MTWLSAETVADYRLEAPPDACECGLCEVCHLAQRHRWDQWTVYPRCEWCLIELAQWIHENVPEFPGCIEPGLCTYGLPYIDTR